MNKISISKSGGEACIIALGGDGRPWLDDQDSISASSVFFTASVAAPLRYFEMEFPGALAF